MNQIYQIRETIIGFYKTYEKVIFSILRFILSFIIFQFISRMGYAVVLTKMPVGILFGIIGTIISVQWFFLLIVVVICTHLAFVSIEAAVLVFVLSTIIYLLYIRLFPKQSLLIIALILGFYFRIPYVVPLFAGLFVGVSGIVPIIFGTLIWHFIPHIQSLIEMKSSELMEMPNTLANMYISTIQWLAKDQTTIITIIIFCVTVITVHLIAKLSIDYSWYIAIGIGAVVNLIGFLIGLLIVDIDINLFGVVLSTIASMIIMFSIQFFHIIVDYSRAERVEFEDEENYYYVKIIPKINLEKPKREIKRIVQD